MNKLNLPIIDETCIIDNDKIKEKHNVFSHNTPYSKTGECVQKIGCCGGNKQSNAIRIKPRTFGLFAIGLIFWVFWNKYHRKTDGKKKY